MPKTSTGSPQALRPLLAPMHVVRVADVLAMTELLPHEALHAQGKLIEYDGSMGDVIFVSHEWLSSSFPDPSMQQFDVLQQTLRNLISGAATVQMCFYTARAFGSLYPTLTPKLATKLGDALIWYDYFSIPQAALAPEAPPSPSQAFAVNASGVADATALFRNSVCHRRSNAGGRCVLAPALCLTHTLPAFSLCRQVDSIPAYIARCRWFFILAPFAGLQHRERRTACTYETWLSRGCAIHVRGGDRHHRHILAHRRICGVCCC